MIQKREKDINAEINKKNYSEILINTIVEQISQVLEDAKTDISKVSLIGIAVPGTVTDTQIVKAENLHIKNLNLASEINKYYNVPIRLRNDDKCVVVVEKGYGNLRKA